MGLQLRWLERTPDKREVGGSSPLKPIENDKKITITVSDRAKAVISEQGYDVTFGARPLKRFIQSRIETLVAREMIKGYIKNGSHVLVDFDDDFKLAIQ